MNNENLTEKAMNERIRSFIGKLPVRPDDSGVIRIRKEDGTEYSYHAGSATNDVCEDRMLVFEPFCGLKHIVSSYWSDIVTLEYGALADGTLFYAKIVSPDYMRFIKRILRLNILFVFDPENHEADRERPCFAGEDGSVIYTEKNRVVKMYPDGTSTTLFDIDTGEGSGRVLKEYLDRDHILVFGERYRGMIDHESFYHETGELFVEPTRESLVDMAAGSLVKAIIDWEQPESYSMRKSTKKPRRLFNEFRDNGFDNIGVSYNTILSVINACTQLRIVLPRRRDLLVKTINSFIEIGIPAKEFPVAAVNILDSYNREVAHCAPSCRIAPEIVPVLKRLADDTTLDADQKRETVLNECKFMEYMKKTGE